MTVEWQKRVSRRIGLKLYFVAVICREGVVLPLVSFDRPLKRIKDFHVEHLYLIMSFGAPYPTMGALKILSLEGYDKINQF